MNENRLVEGCKAGNRAAMKDLYERYYSSMLGVCFRYVSNVADAEDFVQEGFIRVFNDIGSFQAKGSLEGWIRRVMINSVLMQLRKTKREFAHDDLELTAMESQDQPANETEEDGLSSEIMNLGKAEVVGIIRTLPEGFRQVLNLYVIDGYKHREIAEMLGISEGTSKSQLNRARKVMRSKLTEYIENRKKLDGISRNAGNNEINT